MSRCTYSTTIFSDLEVEDEAGQGSRGHNGPCTLCVCEKTQYSPLNLPLSPLPAAGLPILSPTEVLEKAGLERERVH